MNIMNTNFCQTQFQKLSVYFLQKILQRGGGGSAILQVLVRIFGKMLKMHQMLQFIQKFFPPFQTLPLSATHPPRKVSGPKANSFLMHFSPNYGVLRLFRKSDSIFYKQGEPSASPAIQNSDSPAFSMELNLYFLLLGNRPTNNNY